MVFSVIAGVFVKWRSRDIGLEDRLRDDGGRDLRVTFLIRSGRKWLRVKECRRWLEVGKGE